MKVQISEKNHLNLAKFLILGIVIVFIASPGEMKHWPFIYWSLYDGGNPQIPQKVSRIELRVLDKNENGHIIPVKDLYSLDDDSSSQPGGTNMITKAFLENPKNWPVYRLSLIQYLEKKLNTPIELVEAYQLTWDTTYNNYPPFDLNKPTQTQKIDAFRASDYRN